jgi:RNA polymerase sigma-54 factor
MIKQQLTQKQQQKLSPLQIQQIKLLELNGIDLENRIDKELEENPALEEASEFSEDTETEDGVTGYENTDDVVEDDLSLGDYRTEDDIPDYKLQQIYYSGENQRENIPYAETQSLREFLFDQLYLKDLSEEELKIGEYLIGNVDEDGYIRRKLSAISDDLAFQDGLDVPISKIDEVLKIVQELDPPGIVARDLQECLLIQLSRIENSPEKEIAILILEKQFEAFSKKQFDKILKSLSISESQLKEAIRLITLLNPRPGGGWETALETKMAQITPDFLIEVVNGELIFSMQDQNIPNLKINREYNEMLKSYEKENKNPIQKETLNFVKQKIDSAQWFIDAIKQRNITLKHTMLAIIEIQRDFFFSGDESYLKPMILKDVAEICGYDISTISRVSSSKYVQTNFGIYPLKYFFSEGLINEEGEEVSTREIKVILKQCIEDENKKKPLTDEALGKELKIKGYDIARRTIAKYREQLNIPVARLRKEI